MKKIVLLITVALVFSAASLYAQNAQTRLENGKRLFDQRNYGGAIKELNEAIRLDSKLAEAYAYRSRSYNSNGEIRMAFSDAEMAIQLNPKLAIGYYARGNVYRDMNDYDQAIADYTEVIKLDPQYTMAYFNRGLVYLDKKRDYDRAIADYTEVIKLDPQYINAYNNRGVAYTRKNDYDSAITDFEAILKIDPNNSDGKTYLAEATRLAGPGRRQKAREEANKFDPSKFTVVPSDFTPADYTSVDLFKAVSDSRDLQVVSNKREALNPLTLSTFQWGRTYSLRYVSDLTFVNQNGTDISFSSDDKAITQNMTIDQRSGLQAGQKVRVYYMITKSPLTTWDVIAIERR
jgi:tetratricopeptide (TPR) repeat protein